MDAFLLKWEERIAMTFFAATSIFVLLGAITRVMASFQSYVQPLIWSVEIAQLSFTWACVLGADIALRKNVHIEIDILVRLFPQGVRRFLALLWQILIACFLAILIWYGIDMTLLNVERELGILPISYSWVTSAIPVGAGLMLITVVSRLWRVLFRGEVLSLEGRDGMAL